MKIDHDKWSKLGEENLGGPEGANIRFFRDDLTVVNGGPLTLMKCILNDYWADVPEIYSWDHEMIDMVMSKLYYCWVAMIQPQVNEEE